MASTAFSLIGAGLSAYSQYSQGKAQKKMANYNAAMAQREARMEAATAGENAIRQREQNERQMASMRAKMAASGVSMTGDNVLDVFGATATEYETQVLDVFRDSEMRQNQLQNQAAMHRYQGQQAYSAGKMGAIGSLIGGASRTMGNMYQMRYSGGY